MDDLQLLERQAQHVRKPRITVLSGSAGYDARTTTIDVTDYSEIKAFVRSLAPSSVRWLFLPRPPWLRSRSRSRLRLMAPGQSLDRSPDTALAVSAVSFVPNSDLTLSNDMKMYNRDVLSQLNYLAPTLAVAGPRLAHPACRPAKASPRSILGRYFRLGGMKPLPVDLIATKRGSLASASDNASGVIAGGGADLSSDGEASGAPASEPWVPVASSSFGRRS